MNIQGDIIGIYDANGNVVVEYTYDSWGKLISITGSLASTIGIKNPLRYRGYYYDTETSLYYLQSRYYDPETGRFINMDKYFVAGNDYIQGTNMYAYCYNNPVIYVDPSGMASEKDISGWFGGLWLFAEMCYYFGLTNWIPGLSDVSGEIVDFDFAVLFEFELSPTIATGLSKASSVAINWLAGKILATFIPSKGAIGALITKAQKSIPNISAVVGEFLENDISDLFNSVNIFSDVAPGKYILMSFLFMEEGTYHEYIPHVFYVLKYLGPEDESSLEFIIYTNELS